MLSQDLHFTQFFFAPSNYNPAHIGDFDGDYRVIGNQRRQWASVTIPYQTFAASIDGRFNENKRRKNGIMAGGLNFYNDQSGSIFGFKINSF